MDLDYTERIVRETPARRQHPVNSIHPSSASPAPPLTRRATRHQTRLYRALLLMALVVGGGTAGYVLLEGWDLLDALYMTVITMATVGYAETRPLSDSGRIFTIGLIVASISIAGYAISTIISFVVEGEFYRALRERHMDQRIARLTDHIILCGGGRTGRPIASELHQTRTPFVVIEQDPAVIGEIRQHGDLLYLQGDATQDDTLHLAGIARARGLIAALGDDKDNVFIVLTARSLNPRLRIVARANDDANMSKLIKAGANEVVSPNLIGGLRMASVMLRPAVVVFLDQMLRVPDQTLRVEEIHVAHVPALAGKTLAEADVAGRTGMIVLAIQPAQGGYRFNPSPDTLLQASDILIVIGTPEQIARLHGVMDDQ
ncbi:MAG: NAD-binding protein [Anaerolineae bacterium]|nr:NAD-binding protein [Anaerolineae bacterium]